MLPNPQLGSDPLQVQKPLWPTIGRIASYLAGEEAYLFQLPTPITGRWGVVYRGLVLRPNCAYTSNSISPSSRPWLMVSTLVPV